LHQPREIADGSGPVTKRPWALREPETPEQRRIVDEYVARHQQPQLVRFAPYNDDRLDAQARAGRFERVVFANLDALLTPVWKGYLHLDAWLEENVTIDLIDSPLPPDQLRELLAQLAASHKRFQREHRRRQTIAAAILSVMALIAMAAMLWILPAMR
jgi:hypothetical protein